MSKIINCDKNAKQKVTFCVNVNSMSYRVALKHCLNVAIRRGLLQSNPASKVPMPNPNNERDRVLSDEEWSKLYRKAKPHIRPDSY
jgi:hypothetical protein